MNREIKFRAWDKIQEKMVYNVGIFPTGEAMFPMDYGAELNNKTAPRFVESAFVEDGKEKWKDILMQFTGLKDKNGKEIYEGEILKTCDNPKGETNIGRVEWRNYMAQFVWYCKLKTGGAITCELSNHLEKEGIAESYKIIGNIYENPDLLTKK